ncbi:MAG: flagellar export chaperone FliS [Dissulfurispiraceae bacterium]|jgi:flagellar protein FliS
MVNTAYALNSYTQSRVMGGSPVEMIIMLYDGAIEFLNKAAKGITISNLQIKLKYIDRTLAILQELDRSLNFEAGGEVALRLHDLYCYMMTELVMANFKNDSDKLIHICGLLRTLREGWDEIKTHQM